MFGALCSVALLAGPLQWPAWIPNVATAGALIVGFPLMFRPLGLARWLESLSDRPLVRVACALVYLLVALAVVTPRLSWPGWLAAAFLSGALALVALVIVAFRRRHHPNS